MANGDLTWVMCFGAQEKEIQIMEGHFLPDHVHMLIGISPRYPVTQVIGHI
jgi:putative transposase